MENRKEGGTAPSNRVGDFTELRGWRLARNPEGVISRLTPYATF